MKRHKLSVPPNSSSGCPNIPKKARKRFDLEREAGQEVVIKRHFGKVKKGSFEHRFERRRYLNQLAQEFQTTTVMECKAQVLANLANFAYDPYNYHFFQEIGIIPIFLAELSVNRNETLTDFAIAGICNCSVDKRIQKEILRKDGLPILKRYVNTSSSVTTLLSAITSLVNFLSSGHDDTSIRNQIADPEFHSRLSSLLQENQDNRVKNLVQVLLDELQS